jgi:hypothetical protein
MVYPKLILSGTFSAELKFVHRYHCTSPLHTKLCLSVHPTDLIISFLMQTEGFYEFLQSIKGEGDRGAVPRALVGAINCYTAQYQNLELKLI